MFIGLRSSNGVNSNRERMTMNIMKTKTKWIWMPMAVAILMALSLTACSARLQKDEVILKDIAEEISGYLEEGELRECDEEQGEQRPLIGVRKEDIPAGLQQQYVTVDGEQWEIKNDCIAELAVLGQDTDLQAGKDTLTIALVIDDVVEQATGQLELVYTYDKGWQLESCQGGETFTAEVKPGKELEVTEESLAEEIVAQELLFGNTDTSTEQTIRMEREEISDLAIATHESQYKGREQVYEFGFNLSKERVDFHIDGTARYCYDSDGWVIQNMNLIPKVISANLAGDWYSRYNLPGGSGNVVLSLSETGSDGNVSGVYSYTPNESRKYNSSGSYEVSGTINKETLHLALEAGEGMEEPVNIDVMLYVDNDCLRGTGHESCDLRAGDLVKLVKDTILFAHNRIEKELLLDKSSITCVLKPEIEALHTPGFDLGKTFEYVEGVNPFSAHIPETDKWTYRDYAAVLGSYIFYWEEDNHPEFFGNMELRNEEFMKRFFEYDVFDFDVEKIENFQLAGIEDQTFAETMFPINYDLSFDYEGVGYRALITNVNGDYRVIDVIKDNQSDSWLCKRTNEVNPDLGVKPVNVPVEPTVVEVPKQDPVTDIIAGAQPAGSDPNANPYDPTIGMTWEQKVEYWNNSALTPEEAAAGGICPNAY